MHMRLPFSSPAHNITSLLTCCLLLVGLPIFAFGQQPGIADSTPDRATLQALLTEVRQLRFALERSTSVVPRIQLAFQRLQLQQDRVDRLSKQLQDSRTHTAAATDRKTHFVTAVQQLEVRIGQEQDPTRRKALEVEMKSHTIELEQLSLREQQEQAQEIQFTGQVQTEQAKLNELSDQLNELDKKLQQDQPTPAPGAKP
jgi:adenylate cyclase